MNNVYTTNCIALRTKMAMKGINTIKELSEKSGVGRDTLSRILNGKLKPSTKIIEKLIYTLEITPDEAGKIFLIKTYILRNNRYYTWLTNLRGEINNMKEFMPYKEQDRLKFIKQIQVDRLMEKQLKLLSHKSKRAKKTELVAISNAMVKIAKVLYM